MTKKISLFILVQILLEIVLMIFLLKMGLNYGDFDYQNESWSEVIAGVFVFYIYFKYFFIVIINGLILLSRIISFRAFENVKSFYSFNLIISVLFGLIMGIALNINSISFAPILSSTIVGIITFLYFNKKLRLPMPSKE